MNDGNYEDPSASADKAMILSFRSGEVPSQRPWDSEDWAGEEFAAPDEGFAGELAAGVTSLGFIRAEIKRRAQLWIILAIIGLFAGVGVISRVRPLIRLRRPC